MKHGYKHTSIGVAFMIQLAIVVGIVVSVLAAVGPEVLARSWLAIVIVAGVLLAIFCSLTVEVQPDHLVIRLGPGPFRKTVRLDSIESVKVGRSPWYFFHGVRKIPNGWLLNVSGSRAVEITYRGGGMILVGTTDPLALKQALDAALAASTADAP